MEENYIKFLRNSIIKKIESLNDINFLQIIFNLLMKNDFSK